MTAQANTAGGNGQPLTVTVIEGGRITDYPDRLAMFHVTEWAKYLEDKQRRVHVADVVVLDGEGAPILLPALELSHAGVYGAMNETERTLGVIRHKGKGRGRWSVEADDLTGEQTDLALAYLDAEKAGTLAQVQGQAKERVQTDDRFTDSRLAARVAEEVLADRFIWVAGLKWMAWDGTRWALSEEKTIRRAVMDWVIERFEETIEASKGTGRLDRDEV